MRPYYQSLSETKQQYRRMFHEARASLEARLLSLRADFACPVCDVNASEAAEGGIEPWIESRHDGCGYRAFRQQALNLLENEVGHGIFMRLQAIEAYRNTLDCHMCGMCCRLASSEFSYEQLQGRAAAGDDFARQFTSVFLPYESREAARRKFPDVVAAVLNEADQVNSSEPDGADTHGGERVFFYHCPYIGEDNRCSIYGTDKRPGLCSRYPETPLAFVYEKCAWRGWKNDTHGDALNAHALTELALHWAERLRRTLADEPVR